MKRKYCLIRNDGDLSPSRFVFVVWVGSSLRESTMLALVEEFCKDCGWYFKRWSPVVDSAIEKRWRLSQADGSRTSPPYQMMSISIEKCYQTIIDDSWLQLESSFAMSKQETFMRFRLDPSFLLRFHRSKCKTRCSPSKRRYLSHEMESVISGLVAPAMAIVFLIILDTIVSNLILSITF